MEGFHVQRSLVAVETKKKNKRFWGAAKKENLINQSGHWLKKQTTIILASYLLINLKLTAGEELEKESGSDYGLPA